MFLFFFCVYTLSIVWPLLFHQLKQMLILKYFPIWCNFRVFSWRFWKILIVRTCREKKIYRRVGKCFNSKVSKLAVVVVVVAVAVAGAVVVVVTVAVAVAMVVVVVVVVVIVVVLVVPVVVVVLRLTKMNRWINKYDNTGEKICKITYEVIQQVHENCVHSRMKVLNSGREFASLKWFGRLFLLIATLKTTDFIRLRPSVILFQQVFPSQVACKGWSYFIQAFISFNH